VVEIAPLSTTATSSEIKPSSETKVSLKISTQTSPQSNLETNFRADHIEVSQYEASQFAASQFGDDQFETNVSSVKPFLQWSTLQKTMKAKWARVRWGSLSFASTLYLYPVIDTLLEHVPALFHDEVRLGLQEALVNAAKHGNCLDPGKTVSVRYTRSGDTFWWIISDQGDGFKFPSTCGFCPDEDNEALTSECGRGLFILYHVFDQVSWCNEGKEVHLSKQIKQPFPFSFNLPWGKRLAMAVGS
jgi:serine/threonine-protein kinase RsbW